MANQWPTALYNDQITTTPVACSLPQFASPIAATSKEYVFTQDFMCLRPTGGIDLSTDLNTPHPSAGMNPDYSSFVLVAESERRDMGGGMVRWTRTYARVPDSYSDFEPFSYPFIGTNTLSGVVVITRITTPWVVSTRLQHDFFLVGAGQTYTTAGAIPSILRMHYVQQLTYGGATYGGVSMETPLLQPVGSATPTWPTSDQYNKMIADALANHWNATVSVVVLEVDNTLAGGPPPTTGHMAGIIKTAQLGTAILDTGSGGNSTMGGQIPVEDSRLTRWAGNIWERITRFALAQ